MEEILRRSTHNEFACLFCFACAPEDPPRKIEDDDPDEQVIEVDFLPC